MYFERGQRVQAFYGVVNSLLGNSGRMGRTMTGELGSARDP